MGILEAVIEPLKAQIPQHHAVGVLVAAIFTAFMILVVIVNVLQQLLFRNPNEPPMVFHLFPVIGSSVTYGIDPYKFFFDCRAKVC
jgi:sterol 14alpha-demethylase